MKYLWVRVSSEEMRDEICLRYASERAAKCLEVIEFDTRVGT